MKQASRVRRVFGDAMLSVVALTAVLGTLIAFDPRVREQVTSHLNGTSATNGLTDAGTRFYDLSRVLIQVVRDQSDTHPALMVFVIAAGALVVFMLRT
jgi:hypothetical protein